MFYTKTIIMFRIREIKDDFPDIWRVFISGSSSSGKTFFAKKLIESSYIDFQRIYYYHPDIHERKPVDWGISEIIFSAGLPSIDELLKIPENSCIILDDLFSEAKDSRAIDYLFRVLSGKRKLHVIIMTQRYFSNGVYTLNIRNSSNIHVLLRNADETSNLRVARSMKLKTEYIIAEEYNQSKLYPYVLINRTNHARVNGIQLYIDIFSKYRQVIMKTGLYYLIPAHDFNLNFNKIDESTAIKKEQSTYPKVNQSLKTIILKNFEDNSKQNYEPRAENENEKPKTETRGNFERRVRQVIRRYRKRSLL